MTTYRPGSFFLTTISGPTGFAVGLGQALAGAPSRYSHAGIIVDLSGTTIEAEPGGARYGHVADYAGRPLLISDGPVQQDVEEYLAKHPEVTPARESYEKMARADVVHHATSFIGIGYSPLDYLALTLLHLEQLLTGRKDSRWAVTAFIRRRVQKSGHVICSQLVDAVMERAGIHLFGGRLPGDVMPSDLAAWAEDQEQAQQVAA